MKCSLRSVSVASVVALLILVALAANTLGPVILLILSWSMSWLVASGTHELGHLVAGWLVGFRFQACMLGQCIIYREAEELKWCWCSGVKNWIDGACVSLYSTSEKPQRGRLAIM